MNYSLILLCAGSGKRTGLKYNKIFYKINNQTVYEMNISHFLEDNRCKQIIVVTKENEIDDIRTLVNDSRIEYVFGGKERQDSVYEGLQKVKENHVFIHDGARPYVSKQSINDLVECLKTYDAGLLMVPCKDTIKEVKEGIVVKTLKRETLMQAQTPQVFKSEDIKVAYQKAKDEGYVANDDSQLFERYIDKDIKAVLGDYSNLKITTQEDLSQYETIVGTIKNVGDETLLIETNDHQKYLISIAGAIESNKGLIKGNRIYIYYEGTLDIKNKDIQSIKVKSYKVLE